MAKTAKGRTATNTGRVALGRTTLIREVYRALINTGRTYAAFREKDRETVQSLAGRGVILDPMSGYGGLASFCSEIGIESFGVEYNPPQYYWQLLSNPGLTQQNLTAIELLSDSRRHWPRTRARAIVSDNFFPEETLSVIRRLLNMSSELVKENTDLDDEQAFETALTILLPFFGRLGCMCPGDVSTHTKQGGTCVLLGWQDDLATYLHAMQERLIGIRDRSKCTTQGLVFGDARYVNFGRRRFKALFTSPPYPNHRDFTSIMLPENTLLTTLGIGKSYNLSSHEQGIIGSNFVKGETIRNPSSSIANAFLNNAGSLRRSSRSTYDDEVYYFPYFKRYFAAIEDAYLNVSKFLHSSFLGYVVVVNNTHRGLVVPVSETIQEIWQSLGFNAEVHEAKEMFHYGTKNPRSKGVRARHTEYVVKIWR
jgi:hypothetical protein